MTLPRNAILHADCTQFLPSLPSESVDFILTDPPYLVSYRPRDGRTVSNDRDDAWLKPAFAEMSRVLAADGFCLTFTDGLTRTGSCRRSGQPGFVPSGISLFRSPTSPRLAMSAASTSRPIFSRKEVPALRSRFPMSCTGKRTRATSCIRRRSRPRFCGLS